MNVTLGLKLDPRVVPRSWQFMIKWSDDPIRWLHEWEISCGRSLGQTSQWTDLLRRKQRFETKCVETKSWTGDWRNLMWYIQQRNSWHMWWPCYTNCTSSSNLIGFITFTWLWTFEAPAKHTPPKPPKPPKPQPWALATSTEKHKALHGQERPPSATMTQRFWSPKCGNSVAGKVGDADSDLSTKWAEHRRTM